MTTRTNAKFHLRHEPMEAPAAAPIRPEGLTEHQARMYQAIRDLYLATGLPPTFRDVRERAGISSTSVISYNLKKLWRMGLMKSIQPMIPRLEAGDICPCCGRPT